VFQPLEVRLLQRHEARVAGSIAHADSEPDTFCTSDKSPRPRPRRSGSGWLRQAVCSGLLQAAAHDGWREARAARAFQHVLRQLAELLQRRPRRRVLRREVVARRARVAVLLGQREQAAQRMRAVVEPALQGAAVDQRRVVGQDQLACEVVVVGQQIHRHEAELRVDEQRQLHRLHVQVLAQATAPAARRPAPGPPVRAGSAAWSLVWSSLSSMRSIHQSEYGSSCSAPRFILFITRCSR
jgi:hypothetical protein